MNLGIPYMNEEEVFPNKNNKRAKGLGELVQAKKETAKFRESKKKKAFNKGDSEEDGDSDLNDFIEYDAEADGNYHEVSDSDDESGRKNLKKVKKDGLRTREQDNVYAMMNYQGFAASKARTEANKGIKKENKENLAAKKLDIGNLFEQLDNGELEKQSNPVYLMKSADEKLRADCQSIVVVKPKTERISRNQDEGAASLKKRRRESPERYKKEETKFEVEAPGQLFKATRHPDEDDEPKRKVEEDRFSYANEINDYGNPMELPRESHFPNNEIKTDSMLIEELLEQDRNNNPGPKVEELQNDDQTWDNFCRNVEFKTKTELDTPSKYAEASFLDNSEVPFYYIDIFEDVKEHPGDIFLFGKVLSNKGRNQYESCCIIVKKSEREVYVVPSEYKRGLEEDEDQDVDNVNFAAIMQEFRSKLPSSHQQKLKFKPVDRNYSFDLPILHGKRKYLKVKYDGNLPPLSATMKGKTFSQVIGTTWTLLENFIIKKNLMGPQWLKIKDFVKPNLANKRSWCTHELIVDFKSIVKIEKDQTPPNPPLKVMSFALKSAKINGNWELAAISAMTFSRVDTDKNIELLSGELDTSMFGIVRKLPDTYFPKDFEARTRGFKHPIRVEETEGALITNFISQVNSFDPDILTVHDAYTSVLDTFLGRVKKLKISNWSKLARLKKSYQIDGSNLHRIRHATSGRLICDTFLSSRELIRETDYSLSCLAKNFLGQKRDDFDENSTQAFYSNSDVLMKMIEHTTQDAFITSRIMFRLQIIPLTKHLTCIAGNSWIKSLQNARAERNEMFLIHEFRQRKYIYPDKFYTKNDDKAVFEDEEGGKKENKPAYKKDKKKKYAGGLVLDPKPGLYNNIILLLDFNSLYPSIIREYNICFTTLKIPPKCLMEGNNNTKKTMETEVKTDGDPENQVANQPKPDEFDLSMIKRVDNPNSVLPNVIYSLIRQRKEVKKQLEEERNEAKREIYDIKQKAIKLVANSMYGCLGFASSRFYAKPIAATITRFGRQILEDSAKKVEEKTGMRVIYGDTDSLMIDTQTNKIEEAIELGRKVKKEINDKYKCLEIDIDGIFMPLLLLKKKKYAAMKLSNLGDFLRPSNMIIQPNFKQEVKGLDMVRRDWCRLSKRACGLVLKQVLSGKGTDEVIEGIRSDLSELGRRIRGESDQGCTLDEFIITKQLTKDPSKYPSDKGQPHVQVAKRMLETNKTLNLIHHYIPYVIIKNDKDGLADKAVHSEEFMKNKDKYEIDIDWYLTQQVMPPLQRMLEVIPGIIIAEIALCLGLDAGKYKNARKRDEDDENEDYLSSYLASFLNKSESAEDAKVEFLVRCIQCQKLQKFGEKQATLNMSIFTCSDPTCQGQLNQPQLFNLVKLRVKEEITNYYQHPMSCGECHTKHKNFKLTGPKCPQNHRLKEKAPRDVLTWLRNVKAIFDRKQEEMTLLSPQQKSFLVTVQNYIDQTIKLSRAQVLSLDAVFAKVKEAERR